MMFEPTGQPFERERSDLVAAGAERVPVGVAAVRRSKRVGDCRQQLVELGADPAGERGVASGRLTEVPDAVADMALFVVMDVAVTVDKPRQQLVVGQVAGDELKRGQPQGALDHEVVDRDELDLRDRVGRVGGEPLVGGHERLVEDDRKRLAELLP